MKNSLFCSLIAASLAWLVAFPAIAQSSATQEAKSQLPQAKPRKKNRVYPALPGHYESERKAVRSWLLKAKKKGVGIGGYLNVYNDMERSVQAGSDKAEVKSKLERLQRSIGNQYKESRQLQSPTRKVPKRYTSSGRNYTNGKVDITFGKNRYTTPHEIKKACETAERNALMTLPPHMRNNQAVLDDLRRQRDIREKSFLNRNGFKERGFTRNPLAPKPDPTIGPGSYGHYRYGNHIYNNQYTHR